MPSATPSAFPRVAIIGAGPAGLTFAAVLLHQWSSLPTAPPRVTVYERETVRESRDQGGTLDLHEETGQHALDLAGLKEAFKRVARIEGDVMRMLDKTGKVWIDEEPVEDLDEYEKRPGGTRPEIDRGILKELLIDSLPEGTVKWDCSVTTVTPTTSGKHKLTLSDGSEEEFDLVVAGDGAWSKARKLLTDVVPKYSGIHMIEVRISDVDTRFPELAKLVGPGSMNAFSDNKAIMGQRNSGSRIRVYFALRCPADWVTTSGIDFSSPFTARPGLHAIFSGWTQDLLDLLDKCDEPADGPGITPRAMYELHPETFAWEHKPGLTLIGDAAHLMTPFAGEGANMAMADGAELAEAIVAAAGQHKPDWLDVAVKKYEEGMFPRAKASLEATQGSLAAFMHEDAPASGLKYMQQTWQFLPDVDIDTLGAGPAVKA